MGCSKKVSDSGITKREYFAAMALQGLLTIYPPSEAATLSVLTADILIEELKKEKK